MGGQGNMEICGLSCWIWLRPLASKLASESEFTKLYNILSDLCRHVIHRLNQLLKPCQCRIDQVRTRKSSQKTTCTEKRSSCVSDRARPLKAWWTRSSGRFREHCPQSLEGACANVCINTSLVHVRLREDFRVRRWSSWHTKLKGVRPWTLPILQATVVSVSYGLLQKTNKPYARRILVCFLLSRTHLRLVGLLLLKNI